MTPVRSSGSTFPVAGCDCLRFAMTSEASASLVVAKRRPGRGSSLRSGPARIQQCKTALCLDGGRVWDAEVSQVQLHIGLYAKSSYRGFLVTPYDSVGRLSAAKSCQNVAAGRASGGPPADACGVALRAGLRPRYLFDPSVPI